MEDEKGGTYYRIDYSSGMIASFQFEPGVANPGKGKSVFAGYKLSV